MTKKKETEKKTVLTVFVEGETEVDFYKTMLAFIREKAGKGNCIIEIKNVKGVGNYQSKVCRIFKNGVIQKYPDCYHVVALCYDTDVFQYQKKPPVDWDAVTKILSGKGANKIEQIRAEKSIEDWFLFDPDGLKSFLGISLKTDISAYRGYRGLVQLFQKSKKNYTKGVRCKSLVDALDMNKIFPHICREIYILCDTIGVKCSNLNECCKNLDGHCKKIAPTRKTGGSGCGL